MLGKDIYPGIYHDGSKLIDVLKIYFDHSQGIVTVKVHEYGVGIPKDARDYTVPFCTPVTWVEVMSALSAKAGDLITTPYAGFGAWIHGLQSRALNELSFCFVVDVTPTYVDGLFTFNSDSNGPIWDLYHLVRFEKSCLRDFVNCSVGYPRFNLQSNKNKINIGLSMYSQFFKSMNYVFPDNAKISNLPKYPGYTFSRFGTTFILMSNPKFNILHPKVNVLHPSNFKLHEAKCTCGAAKIGVGYHSSWCDIK